MRGHDEARRREASVQRSIPEVGRSIYIYHDSGDVDLLTEASLRLGPIIITRICKAKWAEPFNPPPPPPLSLSISLSLYMLEFLNWLGLDLLQRAVRFLKRCTSGSACS